MRASVIIILVAVFASCEAQRLELVPDEPPPVETDDGGASGGATAAGGKTSSGGSSTNAGGFGSLGTCQKQEDCRFGGDCENSQCVVCVGAEDCKDRQNCNPSTGRCEPSCDEKGDCTEDPFLKECDPEKHVCVECTDNHQCQELSAEGRFCVKDIGICVECYEHADCGDGNRCVRGDCKCVDDTGCGPDRCDPRSNECVRRQ
jgi:hypothetical protein